MGCMWDHLLTKVRARLGALMLLAALGAVFGVPAPAYAGRLEAGSFTAHATNTGNPNPVRINFQQTFDTVPVVVALSDSNGSDPAAIRITNITTTGFDELILEPDSADGPHASQNIHYLAVEPGRYVMPDGSIFEAGTDIVTAVQHGSGVTGGEGWASIAFDSSLPGTPSVIAHLQTANSETRTVASQTSQPFITATVRNPTAAGFQIALERSEVSGGPIPSAETVGWIAFPAGSSGTFPDVSSNTITWSGVNTSANIAGWDNGCFTNAFGMNSGNAIVVAKKNSHNGGDGGWLRRCSLSNTLIGLTVDEDTSRDTERGHIGESASIIAFSGSFHAVLKPSISVTKVRSSIADEFGTDLALPKATVEYLITVTNAGNAPPNYDSVIVTEVLPSELSLIIEDFAGVGSGPVRYLDGSTASGLNCTFTNFADMNDCFAFSIDGSDFTHQPTDGGDGTDPAITHVRIMPTGYMRPDTGSGSTSFTLSLKAKIKCVGCTP